MKATKSKVDLELDQLTTASLQELRERWSSTFKTAPPPAFGPDLLRRGIAKRIQEIAFGGLPKATQRLLDQLVRAAIAKPSSKHDVPRRIKPGSEFVRTWKGTSHRVVVHQDGFVYGGKTYLSLSEIATQIAGCRWNGPRFFGLRGKTDKVAINGE